MTGMLTLALEAATSIGSVAVLRDNELLASREVAMRSGAEEHLLPAIDESLREAGATVRDLARMVCGAGPGSFTSLRVSASLAKGIAFAQGIPLYAVPSLALIAGDASLGNGVYLAVLDALRGDVFAAAYSRADDAVAELAPVRLVARDSLAREAARLQATVVGPEERPRTNPRAANVVRLGAWLAQPPVPLAAWEPDYGRLAEAQVKWEQAHGRPLPVS
ncbi:MAG TPA: tRNA (adenosine(37)-N6)-threonylcarbamoyltransferase complex dimerization subunit type 1 TsaB [Gemmatimonadaceae bacterium]|nr:tRNA (adenosine(37)-N6)-threonylcarbamoyltransferase complex dimerization subunit type 1 TsaB [Gemmatimonadaceae bacterium]